MREKNKGICNRCNSDDGEQVLEFRVPKPEDPCHITFCLFPKLETITYFLCEECRLRYMDHIKESSKLHSDAKNI